MNSKQIILISIIFITLIGAGWYYYKHKPTTPYSTNEPKTNIKKCIDEYGNKIAEEYNTNNKLIKRTTYQNNGKTITQIDEYTDNEKLVKTTFYKPNGKTISEIHEYNENEKLVKATHYQRDGQTIKQIQ